MTSSFMCDGKCECDNKLFRMSEPGIIISYIDVPNPYLSVIEFAFQRGMPEYTADEEETFQPGDRQASLNDDWFYFSEQLESLSTLAQKWLNAHVAAAGFRFANRPYNGFYLVLV